MISTLALGITGGLIAGISRDVFKWWLKRRRAGSKNINILLIDKKDIEEVPALYDDEGWAKFIAELNAKNESN